MGVPASQMYAVTAYVMRQKAAGRKRFPLVLMLEPLFQCNLACAERSKIQYPAEILRRHLTPEQCFKATEECSGPMVSLPGGEPLLHPQTAEIVEGLIARRKYVHLCTTALALQEKFCLFRPSRYLTINVHLDGQRQFQDRSVCREGVYDIAVRAIRESVKRGFRVTTNTTLNRESDPESVREFFDAMMDLGVEGMTPSPGYCYEKAPEKEYFLSRSDTEKLLARILGNRKKSWKFNQSPLFIQFLRSIRISPGRSLIKTRRVNRPRNSALPAFLMVKAVDNPEDWILSTVKSGGPVTRREGTAARVRYSSLTAVSA